jgi:hypothetical protein
MRAVECGVDAGPLRLTAIAAGNRSAHLLVLFGTG